MWEIGNYGNPNYKSVNEEIAQLKGTLDMDQSRYWLGRFLQENPWFLYSVLTGGENLFPFQVIKLKMAMQRDFMMDVCSRGFAKCQEPDAIVNIKGKGYIALKDVEIGDKIFTDNSYETVLNKFHNEESDGVYIECDYGSNFRVKKGHQVLASVDGNIGFYNAEDLKLGDFCIRTSNELLERAPNPRAMLSRFGEMFSDPLFYYFLGYTYGNVCEGDNGVMIIKGMKRSKSKTAIELLKKYEIPYENIYQRWARSHWISIKHEFAKFFLEVASNNTSEFPEILKNANSYYVRSFFAGYLDNKMVIDRKRVRRRGIKLEIPVYKGEFDRWMRMYFYELGITYSRRKSGYSYDTERTVGIIISNHQAQNALFNKIPVVSCRDNLIKRSELYDAPITIKSDGKLKIGEFEKRKEIATKLKSLGIEFSNSNFSLYKIRIKEDIKLETIGITVENKPYYWSEGFLQHNSYTAAITAIFLALFNPNIKIALLGPSFKQSKGIFKYIEEIAEKPGSHLLKDLIHTRKSGDVWEMELGWSKIFALPLGASGGKVRGYRCNVLIIDEFLEMPKEIVEAILTPFLVVKRDPENRERIVKLEDVAIKSGVLKEEDRWVFPNQKLILLTSAGFKFQYVYQKYQEYIEMILDPKNKGSEISYGLINMSYLMAPENLLDRGLIETAKKEVSDSVFMREYMATFADDSSGYFKMAKMEECTNKAGYPYLLLRGNSGKKYVLAIDSNYKDNENSDHFAMCVGELMDDGKYAVVHQYAKSGFDLAERANYIHYLMTRFNIIYVIIDEGGAEQLIQYLNDHSKFINSGIKLNQFEANFSKSDSYDKILRQARTSYDVSKYKILHRQYFDSNFIVRANEALQASFDRKKMMFGAMPMDSFYHDQITEASKHVANLVFDKEQREDATEIAVDLYDHQLQLIKLVKQECAFIEISVTANGHQSFDLPRSMRMLTGVDRPRKDSYTALLLLNYGVKCYNDMQMKTTSFTQTIVPELI